MSVAKMSVEKNIIWPCLVSSLLVRPLVTSSGQLEYCLISGRVSRRVWNGSEQKWIRAVREDIQKVNYAPQDRQQVNYAPQDGQQVAEAGLTMYASLAETGGVLDLWWLWFCVSRRAVSGPTPAPRRRPEVHTLYKPEFSPELVETGVSGGLIVVWSAIFDYR